MPSANSCFQKSWLVSRDLCFYFKKRPLYGLWASFLMKWTEVAPSLQDSANKISFKSTAGGISLLRRNGSTSTAWLTSGCANVNKQRLSFWTPIMQSRNQHPFNNYASESEKYLLHCLWWSFRSAEYPNSVPQNLHRNLFLLATFSSVSRPFFPRSGSDFLSWCFFECWFKVAIWVKRWPQNYVTGSKNPAFANFFLSRLKLYGMWRGVAAH